MNVVPAVRGYNGAGELQIVFQGLVVGAGCKRRRGGQNNGKARIGEPEPHAGSISHNAGNASGNFR